MYPEPYDIEDIAQATLNVERNMEAVFKLRALLGVLTDADLVILAAGIGTVSIKSLQDQAALADMKKFLGLLIYFRREVADNCMPLPTFAALFIS